MKYSLIALAMIATLATGAMAKEGKGAAGKEPAKTEMTAEQKAEKQAKVLAAIKAKDEALYNELIALKEKDPAAFEAKMLELRKKHHEAGKGKGKGGEKGKGCKDAAK